MLRIIRENQRAGLRIASGVWWRRRWEQEKLRNKIDRVRATARKYKLICYGQSTPEEVGVEIDQEQEGGSDLSS